MKNRYFKYFNFIATSIILLCAALFFYDLFKDIFIYNLDDINASYDPFPLLKENNGRYLCNILSRITLVYIPKLFGLNLQDAANTIGLTLYVFFILLTASASACFLFLKNRKNWFVFNILLIAALLHFIYYICSYGIPYCSMFAYVFGYVLSMFLGLSFIYFLLNYFSNNYSTPKNIIPIVILAFCTGNSTQVLAYVCPITVALFYLYTIFENKFDVQKLKNILLNKNLVYPVIALACGVILMVFSPGFWDEFGFRHVNSISQIFVTFIPFLKEYLQVVFIDKTVYFVILILISLVILIRAYCNKNFYTAFKTICLAFIPIFSMYLAFFTCITLGPTFPNENFKFWVYEPFYNLVYILILFSSFCFLLGYLLQDIKNNKIKLSLVSLFSVVFIIASILFLQNVKDEILYKKNVLTEFKTNVYKCDKIAITQFLNNQDIYLPDYCDENLLSVYVLDFGHIYRYYKAFYGININKIIVTDEQTATDKFNNLGGVISDEELKNLKFKNIEIMLNEYKKRK